MNQQITINGQTITLTEDDIKMLAEKHGVQGSDYGRVPANGDDVFVMGGRGIISRSRDWKDYLAHGNAFFDRESAELTRDWQRRNPYFPRAMARLEAAAKEANGDWVPNWGDYEQNKWGPVLEGGVANVTCWSAEKTSPLPYYRSKEIAESIAKSHEAELRILLGR